ncbi:MAG TPA: cold shock domain-containing protein [Paenisporosarcina sp.]|nr:cold shock domain-containing protein [Paenisporosarcina sp.]
MTEEEEKFEGEVIFFDSKAGYGFIDWSRDGVKQKDAFVHFSDINCEGFKTVKKGQKVTFSIGKNNRGKDKATNVTVKP